MTLGRVLDRLELVDVFDHLDVPLPDDEFPVEELKPFDLRVELGLDTGFSLFEVTHDGVRYLTDRYVLIEASLLPTDHLEQPPIRSANSKAPEALAIALADPARLADVAITGAELDPWHLLVFASCGVSVKTVTGVEPAPNPNSLVPCALWKDSRVIGLVMPHRSGNTWPLPREVPDLARAIYNATWATVTRRSALKAALAAHQHLAVRAAAHPTNGASR